MSKYLVMDAISYLDPDLLAKHLARKEKNRIKSKNKKNVNILKWSSIAACFCLILVMSAFGISQILKDTNAQTGTPGMEVVDPNDNDNVFFNAVDSYVTAGNRLVEPIIVDEADFSSIYNIGLEELSKNQKYEITYRLEYDIDIETNMPDINRLSNGVATIEENGKVIFVMYVSTESFVSSYVFEQDEIKSSQINGCELQLYDLSKDDDTTLYGKMNLGQYYVTCSMYNKTQNDMISFVKTIIDFCVVN